jgi:hypothetical protein
VVIVKTLCERQKILACKPFSTQVLKLASHIREKKTLTSDVTHQTTNVDNLLTTHKAEAKIFPSKRPDNICLI